MTDSPVTIVLDLPPKVLSPNQQRRAQYSRGLRFKVTKAKRAYADIAFCEAREAQGTQIRHWMRATVQTAWYWPDSYHQLDPDNAIAAIKCVGDALERAGVIENDKNFVWQPPQYFVDAEHPRVLLHVTKLSGADGDSQ